MDRRSLFVCDEKAFKIYEAFLIALVILSGIGFVFVGIITIRFLLKVGLKRKVFALFLISLLLALASRIMYLARMLYKNRGFNGFRTVACEGTIFAFSHILFLVIAGILNIYNWLTFAYNLRSFERATRFVKENKLKILSIITPTGIAFVFVWYSAGFIVRCATDEIDDVLLTHNFLEWFGIATTFILAIGFIITGYYLKKKLRDWNEDFEEKARKRINFAVYLLSIPFFVRALYNFIRRITYLDEIMDDSIRDDTLLAPLVTFFFIIIADLIPITSQLVTMLVSLDGTNKGRFISEYNGEHAYENSEYYNNIVNHPGSHTSSILSENDEFKKQFVQNGSRDYSGGLKFKTSLNDNEESRLDKSDDSDD